MFKRNVLKIAVILILVLLVAGCKKDIEKEIPVTQTTVDITETEEMTLPLPEDAGFPIIREDQQVNSIEVPEKPTEVHQEYETESTISTEETQETQDDGKPDVGEGGLPIL